MRTFARLDGPPGRRAVAEPLVRAPDGIVPGVDVLIGLPGAWLDVTGAVPQPGPGWLAAEDGAGWGFMPPPVPEAAPVRPTVTSLAFLALFTPAEQAAVFEAAPTNPALLGFLFHLACAGSVQLDDPRVVAGVSLLGRGGFVAPARPAQVLGNVLADDVAFDAAGATEGGPVRADAAAFDPTRATEGMPARPDAVSFDTPNATEA